MKALLPGLGVLRADQVRSGDALRSVRASGSSRSTVANVEHQGKQASRWGKEGATSVGAQKQAFSTALFYHGRPLDAFDRLRDRAPWYQHSTRLALLDRQAPRLCVCQDDECATGRERPKPTIRGAKASHWKALASWRTLGCQKQAARSPDLGGTTEAQIHHSSLFDGMRAVWPWLSTFNYL